MLCARYGGAEADLRFGSGALPGVFIVFFIVVWQICREISAGSFLRKCIPVLFFFAFERKICNRLQIKKITEFRELL